jgi:hypothetical protein
MDSKKKISQIHIFRMAEKWDDHEHERIASRERLKATWDSIIDKYSRDFGSETDIIDLESGLYLYSDYHPPLDKFILNNGALDRTPAKPFGQAVEIGKEISNSQSKWNKAIQEHGHLKRIGMLNRSTTTICPNS